MIAETSVIARYIVTDGVLSYAVPFPVYDEKDVRVTFSVDGRAETTLVLNSDYTVAVLSSGGGMVTLKAGGIVPAGAALAVISAIPATQEADFSSTTDVDTATLETQLDRQVQMIQQLSAELDRAIKVPAASEQRPEELSAALFKSADDAAASAAQAAQSAREARDSAARAAEIKAAALRELREEGNAQADRLNDLANNHVLTFEREVERAHAEADRAEDAAERAEQIAVLAQGENMEATMTLAVAVSAGQTLSLPVTYLVGRNALRLNWEGVELFRNVSFEEVGENDTASSTVRMLLNIPAGNRLNVWSVASNVARGVQQAEEAARAAADEAKKAAAESADSANAAADAAREAEAHADRAAIQAGIAGDAAQEATEQADRAEEAADDAERAARKAQAAACLAGNGRITVLRDTAFLEDVPEGFYAIDPGLIVAATCPIPLTSLDELEDAPPLDCFFILGGKMECPPCPPDSGNGNGNGDGDGDGDGDGTGPDNPDRPDPAPPLTLCGKRRKLSI